MRVKRGEIWQAGLHMVMCGDALDPADRANLLNGVRPDVLMIDPPYGIDANKMTLGIGQRAFSRGESWDADRPDLSPLLNMSDKVCVWGGNYYTDILPPSNGWLIWHKKNDGRSFSECELAWTNFSNTIRHFSHHWSGEKKLHPTMKPVAVIEWALRQAPCKTVCDLFGGSGTTLIACERLKKRCFLMELDPAYCDVAIDRWERLTGRTAWRLDDASGQTEN